MPIKIAILLTGQLRTFDMVKYLHMNSLISKYDTDLFLGIDINNSMQTEYKNPTQKTNSNYVNKALKFFKPIDYFILDNYDFSKIQNKSKIDLKQFEVFFRQYYTVKKTYKLLINHINKTNKKYDIILRLRFDQFIWTNDTIETVQKLYNKEVDKILYNSKNITILDEISKKYTINFEEITSDSAYLFGFGNYEHYSYANDQFFYHDESILTKIYKFYDNMIKLFEYCHENNIGNKGASIECVFYLYLKKQNINIKKSNIKGIFIRENYN